MAANYVCRLNSENGGLEGLSREDHVFSIQRGDSIEFQLEGGSPLATASTVLLISENTNEYTIHTGSLVSGHWICCVEFRTSGSVKFCLQNGESQTPADYIIINPVMTLSGSQVPFESLSIQTVLSRSLGPCTNWLEIFEDQHSLGYNFFHITPIQVLGGSRSLYCIKDANSLNESLFPGMSPTQRYEKLQEVMKELDGKGIGCMVDVVLNHIAFDSEFVEKHPEAAYNLENSPYLRAAYELDKGLFEFTKAIINRKVQNLPNKNKIETERDLSNIMHILKIEWLPQLKLHLYFQMDVNQQLRLFETETQEESFDKLTESNLKSKGLEYFIKNYALINEGEGPLLTGINPKLVWRACRLLGYSRESSIKELKKALPSVNSYLLSRFDKHYAEILSNIEGDIRYHKIDQGRVEISPENPVVRRYFQELHNGQVVIHNGFIMGNTDVLKDFAGKEGWHYFRRNVVIWADNIKLRYGNSYEDAPALWDYMREYVISMAAAFKGIRLDNAHGTPVNVSLYMLKAAREVNPDLYVMAELFTSDAKLDAHFVKVLGINGLVREALNATDPKKLGALVYEYGKGETSSLGRLEDEELTNSLIMNKLKKLRSMQVPAILYDCTHDNPTPAEKRKAHDALPNAALISMANCVIATTRGYDEFLPQQLSVVKEQRVYQRYAKEELRFNERKILITYSHEENTKVNSVEVKGEWDGWAAFTSLRRVSETNFEGEVEVPEGMADRELAYKFVIDKVNWVHDWKQPNKKFGNNVNNYLKFGEPGNKRTGIFQSMRPARKVLNELHKKMSIEGFSEIYVHQSSQDLFILIRQNPTTGDSYVMITRTAFWDDKNPTVQADIKLPGVITSLELLAVLSFNNWGFIQNPQYINGLKGHLEILTNLNQFGTIVRNNTENIDVLNLHKIPQSFLCIFKTELISKHSLENLNQIYRDLEERRLPVVDGLKLEEINHILWRCSNEELEISNNARDIYAVPNFRAFNYAGIGGLAVEFLRLIGKNSLGHEICNNIRSGDWLLDYSSSRLTGFVSSDFQDFVVNALTEIKRLPRGIIPKHFVKFILALFTSLKTYQAQHLFKQTPLTLLEDYLYLSVSQFWGNIPSLKTEYSRATLSAGLPHFSTGYMRCWGRDTFIAFKGLLLCTSQFEEAKSVILTFASVLRHGLIPNLLDSCRNPRYNSRDSTWFFLYAIKNYIEMVPDGHNILNEKISMVFKSDNQEENYRINHPVYLSLFDVVQNIMQSHAKGIEFREWNAGTRIDGHMRDEGFNVRIRLDPNTGVVYGGNRWNCGTWMDKMGSSAKANNSGVPATPRDGAAIEITALIYSAVSFLDDLSAKHLFPYTGVELANGQHYPYSLWREKLKQNFDRLYFIKETPDTLSGYYRDTLCSQLEQDNNKLRPNMCIALAVAPDLFNTSNAISALDIITKELMPGLGGTQIGIRTLNSTESVYRGYYDNSNDSNDYYVAHGFSYHNGPEWLWPVGFYLQSVLTFTNNKALVLSCLRSHLKSYENSLWMSLPELTNAFGAECTFSCKAQAWSIGPLIEVVQMLNNYS